MSKDKQMINKCKYCPDFANDESKTSWEGVIKAQDSIETNKTF